MPGFILSMFSGIFGAIGNYFVEKQKRAAQEQMMQDQMRIQAMKMEADGIKADGVAANTRLKSTGRNFKYITFIMWFTPFVLGIIKPSAAAVIFQNFELMPTWYSQSCTILMFAIWGISVSAPVVQTVFSSLGNYLQGGREHRETLARINRDAVFAALRAKQGALSQKTVDEVNAALDAGESSPQVDPNLIQDVLDGNA